MPPCAFKRAHWARAITWAISFWAIDRPFEAKLSSWSCELDSGHTLHGSIPGGCIERSRRFLGLTGPPFVGPAAMRVGPVSPTCSWSGYRNRPRQSPAETAVWPLVVVDGSPVSDDRLRLEHGVACLDREHLVADAGAERLDERVLPRRAGLDEAAASCALNGSHAGCIDPCDRGQLVGPPGFGAHHCRLSSTRLLVTWHSTTQRAPA
jgi:hypothetical protein